MNSDLRIAREIVSTAKVVASLMDAFSILIPGLDVAIDNIPSRIQSPLHPSVLPLIDKVLSSRGFGTRHPRGPYGEPYWLKNGRMFRIHGNTGDDYLLMKEIVEPW